MTPYMQLLKAREYFVKNDLPIPNWIIKFKVEPDRGSTIKHGDIIRVLGFRLRVL